MLDREHLEQFDNQPLPLKSDDQPDIPSSPCKDRAEGIEEYLLMLKELRGLDPTIPAEIIDSTNPNQDRLVRKGVLGSILTIGTTPPVANILRQDKEAYHHLLKYRRHCMKSLYGRSLVTERDIALGLETIKSFIPVLERFVEQNQISST